VENVCIQDSFNQPANNVVDAYLSFGLSRDVVINRQRRERLPALFAKVWQQP
jgi:hypothetical protein